MGSKKRLKNRDVADQVQKLQAALWALALASTMGIAAGVGVALMSGVNPFLGAALGFVLIGGGVYFVAMSAVGGAASVARMLHDPSGSSTPAKREYSRAQSLVVRGLYDEAAIAYEVHCMEYPEDPDPYFRLARLLRDHLNKPADAVSWFKRARADAKLSEGQELIVAQEIIELYVRKLGEPRKAIPELALICGKFPGTPSAEAAERELAEMRRLLALERDGDADFTEQFLARFKDPTPEDVEPS